MEDQWEKRWERGLKIQKAVDYSLNEAGPFQRMFGKGIFHWLYVYEKDGPSAMYVKKREYANFEAYYLNQFAAPSFYAHFENYEKLYEPHLAFLTTLKEQDVSALNKADLLTLLREYKKSLADYQAAYSIVIFWEPLLETTALNILRSYFPPEEIERQAATVFSITSNNYLTQEELDLSRIAPLPAAKRMAALAQHARQYSYIPMYDYDYDPYPMSYFEERLENLEQVKVSARQAEIQENYARFEKFLSQPNLSALDKTRLKAIHFLYNHKDQRSHYRSWDSFIGRSIYQEIARRHGYTLSEVLFLLDEEIEGLLTKKVSRVDVQPRAQQYALIYTDGDITLYTGAEARAYIMKHISQEVTGDIRGIGVSAGIAHGKVRIIKTIKDLTLIEEGDILVTSMTRPDYVSAMKKCVAIVTDEGGMLCHAAIVSRELKIPCVVGTKNATSVLKHGDRVEVNAGAGSVRILV